MTKRIGLSSAPLVSMVFLAVAHSTFSQTRPEADLSIELTEDIPFLTPPGSLGTFKFNVTNHGPELVDFCTVNASPIPFIQGSGEAIFFSAAPEPDNDCVVEWGIPDPAPDAPLAILFSAIHPPLAAGESSSCEVQYSVNPDFDFSGEERILSGQLSVEWQAFPVGMDDPNRDDNTITLNFLFFASPIPVLSPAGMAVMIAMIFVAFALLQKRIFQEYRARR